MFKIGFSSQYYFLKTIYVSGLLFIVIGIVTLILNDINPFLDFATPFIILFIYSTSKIILTLSSLFIHIFKIWEIEKEQKETNTDNNDKLFNDNDNNNQNKSKILDIKEQETLIEENIKTERLILDMTKKQFIAQNKKWLRDEIQNIITPRTLLKNKKLIIKELGKKYSGVVKTDYNILPVKFYSPNNSLNNDNETDNDNENQSEINSDNYSYNSRKNNFKSKTKKNKKILEILKIWKNRANLNTKLMKIIKLTILEMKKKKCCICGNENNLDVFYTGNLVNAFINYLKEKNKRMDNYKEIDFKIYFKNVEKNNIETRCINCY